MSVLLLAALFAPSPEPSTPAPKGVAPQFAYVQAKGGFLSRTGPMLAPVTVAKQVEKVVGGKKVIVTTYVTEYASVNVNVMMSLDKATFSTASGKKLDKEAALKALAKPQLVLFAAGGTPVDRAYLRMMKPGTIVIAWPAPTGGTTGGTGAGTLPPLPPPAPPPVPLPPIRGR
jgi:hypothetical protein